MNLGVIAIFLHLGLFISLAKDLEKTVADAVTGKAVKPDLKQLLDDVSNFLTSGLVNIPGITPDEIKGVIADIEKAIGLDPTMQAQVLAALSSGANIAEAMKRAASNVASVSAAPSVDHSPSVAASGPSNI